jgi:hypothetical protein
MTGIRRFFSKTDSHDNESAFNDKIKVHTAPSGTQYVNSIDLLFTKEEKEELYKEAEEKSKEI